MVELDGFEHLNSLQMEFLMYDLPVLTPMFVIVIKAKIPAKAYSVTQ